MGERLARNVTCRSACYSTYCSVMCIQIQRIRSQITDNPHSRKQERAEGDYMPYKVPPENKNKIADILACIHGVDIKRWLLTTTTEVEATVAFD